MINTFLKAKHWHLFVLTFVLPFIFSFGFMAMIIVNAAGMENGNPDPEMVFGGMKYMFIFFLPLSLLVYGWIWSVTVGLNLKIDEAYRPKLGKFKLAFYTVFCVMILIFVGGFVLFSNISAIASYTSVGSIIGFGVLMLLNVLIIICTVYIYAMTAKTIKTIDIKREAFVGDYIGEFFLIYFFPIGIWFLQPMINKAFNETDEFV